MKRRLVQSFTYILEWGRGTCTLTKHTRRWTYSALRYFCQFYEYSIAFDSLMASSPSLACKCFCRASNYRAFNLGYGYSMFGPCLPLLYLSPGWIIPFPHSSRVKLCESPVSDIVGNIIWKKIDFYNFCFTSIFLFWFPSQINLCISCSLVFSKMFRTPRKLVF